MTTNTWTEDSTSLYQRFHFQNYHEVMAFVNAVAWIAHQEDHHPDLSVHYNHVDVCYTTHDAGGLTEKDRRCVARIDALWTTTS